MTRDRVLNSMEYPRGRQTRLLRLAIVFLVAVFCERDGFGQSISGVITGVVRDPQRAAVAGAAIVARSQDTSEQVSGRTGADGDYRLANLTPGSYNVEVSAPGFRSLVLAVSQLGPGQALRLDANLEIGQVSESITVQDAAGLVNTDDAQLGGAVREIPRMPVLSGAGGRSPLALVGMLPGVGTRISTAQPGNFAINGQRVSANNFLFDGADANNQVVNIAEAGVAALSPNALAEFRVITGAMKAEFGRNSGSVVIATPKSGTNQWHGLASEVLRNTVLNATPFFQNSVAGGTTKLLPNGSPRNPKWNTNDFDANLGGPIWRDKSFLFVSYLGFRRRQGSQASATVPNSAQRAVIEARGVPAARALLAGIPAATAGNLLLSVSSNSLSRDQGLAKFDHTFSKANRFSATYFIEDSFGVNPFSSSAVPGFGVNNANRQQNVVLRDSHSFSPAVFHDFRASFHRTASNNLVPVNRTKLASLGLGNIVPDNPDSEGPPWVVIAGFASFGNTFNGPQSYKINGFQYLDNVSWTKERHNFKFGADFRTFSMNTTFDNSPNGNIIIDGSGTATNLVSPLSPILTPALNDFASGFVTQFSQTSSARVAHRQRAVNLFAQDDWKIRSWLTLNIGVRWEFNGPYTDLRNRMVGFRRGVQSKIFPDAPEGLVYPGDPGVSRSTYTNDYNDFSPRFGLAWDILRNGKLILRSGYGLFYDAPIQEILMGASLFSPPFSVQPTTRFTEITNPWLGARVNPIQQPFPHTPPRAGDRVNFRRYSPLGLTFLDPSFRTPYGQQWHLQLQYEMQRIWLLEAGYVGSNGVKLSNERQYNYALAGPGATAGNIDSRRWLNQGNPQNALFGGAVFGPMNLHTGNANSNYNAFQLHLRRKMARGLQMSHSYTWSHSIDNASGRRVSSRYDPRQDRGNGDSDARHMYALSFVYDFPFRGKIAGGWGISGLTTISSGLWLSVLEPEDRCLCGTGNQRADTTGARIAFLNPRSVDVVAGRPNSWFDGTGGGTPTAGANPYFRRVGTAPTYAAGAGRYGTAGRNTIQGPGLSNWNLAAFKRTSIRERHIIELRGEFFNALNHTQFGLPDVNIASPNFGRITGTSSPRVVQLGLRYQF